MSAPRFYAVELSGYGGGTGSPTRVKETIHVYVLDRAYGHREVARYIEDAAQPPGKGWPTKAQKQAWARDSASAVCARLNAEHDAWLAGSVA